MKKVILLFLVLIVSGCSHTTTPPEAANNNENQQTQIEAPIVIKPTYEEVDVTTAKEMIDTNPNLIIIDVSPVYAQGHIPGAINHYVGNGDLDKAIPNLDKEATYLVYCHNDSASIAGAQKLANAGFKNVFRLKGNYNAWVEAGYDTEK